MHSFNYRHALLTIAVAGGLLSAACTRNRVGDLLDPRTPRERYVQSLERAGLGDTALVRDWTAAADAALREAQDTKLPLADTVSHEPSRPRAFGYRLHLRRGRVLRVDLELTTSPPAMVFVELFDTSDLAKPITVSDRDTLRLEHEVEKDGEYILRIQPELLRGGPMRIERRASAALRFPVHGRGPSAVKSVFGEARDGGRRDHHGIDIFAPRDTPVLAASPGLVTWVGTNRLGGNVVWVWNAARGQSHYYAHLSRQAVSIGQQLSAGDVVGYVGNSGNARTTPPHLHFGIYSRAEGAIDPLPYVE